MVNEKELLILIEEIDDKQRFFALKMFASFLNQKKLDIEESKRCKGVYSTKHELFLEEITKEFHNALKPAKSKEQ